MFFLTAGIYLFGGVVYLIFASGEVEEWAKTTATGVDKTSGEKPAESAVFTLTSSPGEITSQSDDDEKQHSKL